MASKSKVFFSSVSNKKYISPLQKISRLLERCDIDKKFEKGQLIAIKTHFGEFGNTAFIRPIMLRPVVEKLKQMETRPYLTDTNTLYIGMRGNSIDHLNCATWNGWGYSTLQVPIIIADGLRGENTVEVDVDLHLLKKVKLASDIINADGMVCVSHFKGHQLSGFGGAIKNISMGCASRQGKLDMHSNSKPYVSEVKCIKCGKCLSSCQVKAISMREKSAWIDTNICVGCVRCMAICPVEAIDANWNSSSQDVQKKMAEYAFGLKKSLKDKIIFVNLVTEITPECDCFMANDVPIAPDIGYLASTDPVALDKACYDLVCKASNKDPFKEFHKNIDSIYQLQHGYDIGLGNIEYDLIDIG